MQILPFHDTYSNYINERIMFEGHRSKFVSSYTSDFLLLRFSHAVGNILFSSANTLDCAKIENKKDMLRKKIQKCVSSTDCEQRSKNRPQGTVQD